MIDRIPYTYRVTFHKPNHKYDGFKYIGGKWAKGCKPTHFWVKYFTSSKIVKQLINEFGSDAFEVEIIKSDYISTEECIAHEAAMLTEVDAMHNPLYFNASNGDKNFCNKFATEETKQNKLKAFQDKYEADHMFVSEYFKEKSKETCLEKYGVENSFQDAEVRERAKETIREKYGVDNPAK